MTDRYWVEVSPYYDNYQSEDGFEMERALEIARDCSHENGGPVYVENDAGIVVAIFLDGIGFWPVKPDQPDTHTTEIGE